MKRSSCACGVKGPLLIFIPFPLPFTNFQFSTSSLSNFSSFPLHFPFLPGLAPFFPVGQQKILGKKCQEALCPPSPYPVAASMGAWGANAPQSEALPPTCPPQKKKWPKSAIFGKFLDFCPLRIAFCPLDAPHKKKKNLVPPLPLPCLLLN